MIILATFFILYLLVLTYLSFTYRYRNDTACEDCESKQKPKKIEGHHVLDVLDWMMSRNVISDSEYRKILSKVIPLIDK